MTANQIAYQREKEAERHNRATEEEDWLRDRNTAYSQAFKSGNDIVSNIFGKGGVVGALL